VRAGAPSDTLQDNLGPLAELMGSWRGKGFNLVSLPDKQDGKPFRLMLNATMETLAFTPIGGKIPNRGSLQGDIFLFGLSYMQQVSDAVTNEGLHFEPGLWLNLPVTTNPPTTPTVARLGTIPHGDALLAQGDFFTVNGAPQIDPVDSTPFKLNAKTGARNNETDAGYLAPFTSTRLPAGIPTGAIANPNVVLTNAIKGQKIVSTVVLRVNAAAVGGINGTPLVPPNSPSTVGNISNVPFVTANANAGSFSAIFWIETVQNPDGSQFMQLQYTQTIIFDFLNVKWPHISVATLIKQ
jgi:hypothetical protein